MIICDLCSQPASTHESVLMAHPESAFIRGARSNNQRVRGEFRCGTDAGYAGHRRRGEDPCPECKTAHAEANRWRNR